MARLDPDLGPRLKSLPCELVWATTWMSDANEYIAPRLGLPQMPVVDWPDPPVEAGTRGLHWKTPGLVGWAAGRPFAWVDDEITDIDRCWVEDTTRHRPSCTTSRHGGASRGRTSTPWTRGCGPTRHEPAESRTPGSDRLGRYAIT